jgi:hypothetical protein
MKITTAGVDLATFGSEPADDRFSAGQSEIFDALGWGPQSCPR